MGTFLNRTLTIDPGDHTGWAYWNGTNEPMVGQYNVSKSKNMVLTEDDLAYLMERFSNLLDKFDVCTRVYIEGVELWEGSLRSMTSAKRGNVFKLAYLVGGYFNEARRQGIETRILPAREWKGQLPNDVLERRLRALNGVVYASDHILNAVGIGFSRVGLLTQKRGALPVSKMAKQRGFRWK